MGDWAEAYRTAAVDALAPLEDPERADQMAAYMKDHFPFLGVTAQPRRAAVRAATGELGRPPSEDELLAAADACWDVDERELQYVATDLLARHRRMLTASALPSLRRLIETKSWWDTVDALASPTVGSIVLGDPELGAEMDRWVDDEDLWVARTAIIHQLRFKEATDADRLFDHCLRRAADTDFFLRKAIGWALRQYARTAPAEVRAFVAAHRDELSPLSVREATKHL
ncbi:MAG: DNA alkylation repair protein [Actinomycetota bacterium]